MSKTEKVTIEIEIIHTRNSLGTKFQLKLTLNFWTKLTQNRYFQPKTMEASIKFYIFELI